MNMDYGDFFDNMIRCTRCILPETFPSIEFDEEGVCNYCREYVKIEVMGEEKLWEVLSRYVGKGEKYDCLVPISGGRDSAFTLHQIVRKYGMRTLTLTVDSGGITSEGYRNIEWAKEKLGVDHVWIKDESRIESSKRNMKLKLQAWLKKPSINTIVPVLNAGDKTMNLQIFKYASSHGIPLVLGGNNIGNSTFEQEHFKTGYMGVFPDERGLYSTLDRVRLLFLFAHEYLRNPHNFHWSILREYIEGLYVYFFESLSKPRDVATVGFYNYIYWNEEAVLSTIFKELDWKGAIDTTETWRVDDVFYPLIDYMYLRLVGFTEFDEHYSKLVREGQVSREEALTRCRSANAPRLPLLKRIIEEMEVKREEVDKVLDIYREKLLTKILKNKGRGSY